MSALLVRRPVLVSNDFSQSRFCFRQSNVTFRKWGLEWDIWIYGIFPDFVTQKTVVFYNWLINNIMYICVPLFWGTQKFFSYVCQKRKKNRSGTTSVVVAEKTSDVVAFLRNNRNYLVIRCDYFLFGWRAEKRIK